jgi:hypothetical protein
MNLTARKMTPVEDSSRAKFDREAGFDASASSPSSISCLLLSLAFLACAPVAAQAHDIYSGLVSNYGTACCDDSDCRPAHFKVTATGVQMQVNRKWISVPASAIQYRVLSGDKGETAGGHWCGRRANDVEELNDGSGNGYFTFCVFLPPRVAPNLY